MNYTLHQLQVFLKITQTGSITKAAEELYLTQPAVSIQLRNFQEQFDIPLTEIVGRKIKITDFGREIASAAERILNEVYAINYKTHAHKGLLSGRLKVAVVSTGKYVIPYYLADFIKAHEGIELVMDVTNRQKVIESLEQGEVDFALVSILPQHLEVEKIEIMQNKLHLVGKEKPVSKTKMLDQKVLNNLPLIFREQGSGTRSMMEKFVQEHQIKASRKLELTSNEAVKQALIAGLGYSIMPVIGLKNELANGDLQLIPVRGLPMRTNWYLIWLKGKLFSPAAKAWVDFLHAQKQMIAERDFGWTEHAK